MQRILFLDGFRAVSILLVLFFHYTYVYVNKYSGEELSSFSISFGGVGVNLFFMISGFVIFMTIKKKDLIGFIISRFSRLFPVYWVGVCVTTVCLITFGQWYAEVELLNFLKNLTMLQYFLFGQNIDGVYWSLRVELTFYVMLAIVYYGFNKKYFWPFILIITMGAFAINWLHSTNNISSFYVDIFRKLSISQFLPYFTLGMTLYFFTHEFIESSNKTKYIAFLTLIASIIDLLVNKTFVQSSVLIIASFLLVGMCYQRFILVRYLLEMRVMLFFGRISYSLYLIHQVVGYLLIHLLVENGLNLYPSMAITFVIVVAISSIMQKYVENGFSNKLSKQLISYA